MPFSAEDVSRSGERRVRVIGDRVACWRIGLVDLDRCRECVYLLRLEDTRSDHARQAYVVCANATLDADVDFAW